MAVYTALCMGELDNYENVKKAVLHCYIVNEESHCLQFHRHKKQSEESYWEWICQAAQHLIIGLRLLCERL